MTSPTPLPPLHAPRKLKVATVSLAGCFGCHMSHPVAAHWPGVEEAVEAGHAFWTGAWVLGLFIAGVLLVGQFATPIVACSRADHS